MKDGAVDGVDEKELAVVGDDGDLIVEVVVDKVTDAVEELVFCSDLARVWMDGWIDGWMDECMDECMDG